MSRKNLQKKKECKAFSEVHNSLVLKDPFFFFLVALGLIAAWGFSLVAVIRGCSLVVVQGLLIVVVLLIPERGRKGLPAQ